MRIRSWLPLVIIGLLAACSDSGLTDPENTDLTAGPPPPVAHFNLTAGGDAGGPTVTTDREDYAPGDTVTISGSGWLAGETVELLLEEDPATHDPLVFSSVADENGDFVNRDFVVEEHDAGVTFALTATGLTSGLTAVAGFTDGATLLDILSITPASPATNQSFSADIRVRIEGAGGARTWRGTWWWIDDSGPNPCGLAEAWPRMCADTPDHVNENGTYDVTVTGLTAPATAGGYRLCMATTQDYPCAVRISPVDRWDFAVIAPPANTAPVLTLPADYSTQWGVALSDTATATDNETPPQTLTFSVIPPLVSGVSIDGGTGVISWTPTSAQIGANTITVRVVDSGSPALADTASYTITVGKRATQLVYGGSTSGQYSDEAALSATLTDNGGGALQGNAISGKTVNFTLGTQNTSATTSASGVAAVDLALNQMASSTTVASSFTEDALYLGSSDSDPFTIYAEDASVEFDSGNPASVLTGTALSLTVRVMETYPEPDENDGALAGSIGNADVTVALNSILGGGGPSGTCTSSVGGGSNYAAYEQYVCSFGVVPVGTYSVDVDVVGGYYDGSGEDVLTVYDPSLGFVTGGGKFILGGDRVSFGFSVTNTKGKTSQRGGIVVVRHHADGSRCRAKSNSVSTAISGATATLSASKSTNYSCVDAYGNPISGKGNLNLAAYVEDNGEPGNGVDRFWVRVYGDLMMATPAGSNAEIITGGNIQVPHK